MAGEYDSELRSAHMAQASLAADHQRAQYVGRSEADRREAAHLAHEAFQREMGVKGGASGGALLGSTQSAAVRQQSRGEPGKLFPRSDILAILKGHLALATARPAEMTERDAIRALITTFENLE